MRTLDNVPCNQHPKLNTSNKLTFKIPERFCRNFLLSEKKNSRSFSSPYASMSYFKQQCLGDWSRLLTYHMTRKLQRSSVTQRKLFYVS